MGNDLLNISDPRSWDYYRVERDQVGHTNIFINGCYIGTVPVYPYSEPAVSEPGIELADFEEVPDES